MNEKTEIELDETLTITGYYHPGEPERGPTYECGGEPAVPAYWDDVHVVVDGIAMTMTPEVVRWAIEKLEENRDDE